MESENIIKNELRELAPTVADIGVENVFSVPPGYFDNLAFDIINKIERDILPVPANPFEVPAAYFESFASNVMLKIQEEETRRIKELEETAPVLAKIGNKNVYTVDKNYFENTLENWKKPIAQTPVIAINSFKSRLLRLAAAASVLGLVITASILYVNNNHQIVNDNTSTEIRKQLANLSTEDISNYLQKDENHQTLSRPAVDDSVPDIENMLKKATDDEIEKYLESDAENDEDILREI